MTRTSEARALVSARSKRQRLACFAALAYLFALPSCGRDRFAQELGLEADAVALTREGLRGEYTMLTTKELRKRLQEGDQASYLLVDAMPANSFAKEHIEGAKNFLFPKDAMNTWDSTETGGKSKADYEDFLGPDKKRPIFVYCGFVKCLRSHNAAMWARRLGYEVVQRHPGGLFAWKGAGYPLASK